MHIRTMLNTCVDIINFKKMLFFLNHDLERDISLSHSYLRSHEKPTIGGGSAPYKCFFFVDKKYHA